MSEGQQAQFKNFTTEQQWGHVNAYNSNPNGYMNGLSNLQGQNMPVDGKAMFDIPAPETSLGKAIADTLKEMLNIPAPETSQGGKILDAGGGPESPFKIV